MKKIVTSMIAAIFIVSAISTSAFAKDETKLKAGITPDSILYPIDRLVENIQLKFTGDAAKKVNLLIKASAERFDEAEEMAVKEKDEKSVKALEDGQEAIEEAEKVVAKKDDGTDEELEKAIESLGEYVKKSAERLLELSYKDNKTEHAQLVLTRVARMQQVNYLEKLIRKAEKAKADNLDELKTELGKAEELYKEAQDKVEEYKNISKEELKDNDKNTTPKDKNDKAKENNGQPKDKEVKENKGQSKEKKNN